MVRDLQSIARFLGGALRVGGEPHARSPVSGAVALADFTVAPHLSYVVLVVGGAAELSEALAEPARGNELRRAVLVVTDAEADTLEGATAIVGARGVPDLILPRLQVLLAEDAAAEDRGVLAATKVLALAARRSGVSGVIDELAHRLDGWAVLLDRDAQPIAASAAGRLHINDATAVAFNRPVRVRSRALQVHSVGPGEDLSAILVVSTRGGHTTRARDLGSQAAALLDLLLRTHDRQRVEQMGRATMLRILRDGGDHAVGLLREWGVREHELAAFSLTARSSGVDSEKLVQGWLDDLGAAHLLTAAHGVVSGFVRTDHCEYLSARVASSSPALHLGIGGIASIASLARSSQEAEEARAAAVAENRSVVRYSALPTVDLVLERLSPLDSRRLTAVLDPLENTGLIETLRTFLACNGGWALASAQLGVHRQTLAARMLRIETLTGLTMSSPDHRAAAWIAVRARLHAEG